MTNRKPVSAQKFVATVQERLAPLYGESDRLEIGKNKILFNINCIEFRVDKAREKTTDKRQSFIECVSYDDMYPCIIAHDDTLKDFKYYESDINKAVHVIDSFIIQKLGKSFRSAICADYSVLKWALLPMFISDTTDEPLVKDTQQMILELLASEIEDDTCACLNNMQKARLEKSFGRFVAFLARNIYTDETDTLIIFAPDEALLNIYRLKLLDGRISDKDRDITRYELSLDDYPEITLTTAIKKLFRDCYDFSLCANRFEYVVPDEKPLSEQDEELTEQLLQDLIRNKIEVI